METLEIIIGLIFIYLLLSLLATTAQELFASLTSLRGKVLLKAIAKLLEVDTVEGMDKITKSRQVEAFKEKIKNSKVYRKYSSKFLWVNQLPSYLSSEQVTAVIQELLGEDTKVPDSYQTRSVDGGQTSSESPLMLSQIRQDDLRKHLNTIHKSDTSRPMTLTRSATGETVAPEVIEDENVIEKAKASFKKHYDEIMNRATGWYKKSVQWNLIVIGLIIALAFDADTFKIYTNLTGNPDDRQKLIELATNFSNENKIEIYTAQRDTTSGNVGQGDTSAVQRVSDLRSLMDSLLVNEIQNVPSPLGLGWQKSISQQLEEAQAKGREAWKFYIFKLFGWIVTALAVSLGAPFWFDMLQKVINIRNSGIRPQDAEKKQTPVRP